MAVEMEKKSNAENPEQNVEEAAAAESKKSIQVNVMPDKDTEKKYFFT